LAPEQRRDGPLRVALVGVGSAATRAHLPALSRFESTGSVAVVGVCDPDAGRRDGAIASHRGALGFADNDEMLEATTPELLVIATPPSAHLEEMTAAAARGVQVLCEKPLGLSDADVGALGRLTASHPELTLATVHQYRYATPWRWVARAAAGAVAKGEPFRIEVSVERPGTDPLSAGGWRADPEHEGGILGDHAVHYLSLLQLLDADCEVLACHREGPGGRETAWLQVRVGAAGVAAVHVSYSGARRANLVRLDRPAQCLELEWDNSAFTVVHGGHAGVPRDVASLSDRAVVNALYLPMYQQLITRLADPVWRAGSTEHTLGSARLLAAAIRLAR
jgi:predicted dehydrogenase